MVPQSSQLSQLSIQIGICFLSRKGAVWVDVLTSDGLDAKTCVAKQVLK